MPVNIPDQLPAAAVLAAENIFLMAESRARQQDIRPIELLILNLMPNKIDTEIQLLRLLGNTPLQVNVSLLRIHNRVSRHTPQDHMNSFYCDFDEVRHRNFDGLIITGAPLGQLEFAEVDYWQRLRQIIDWSQQQVTSVLFLCWAAHAGLYHLYGLERRLLATKRSGVYCHRRLSQQEPLLRGFDEAFFAPHSRVAEIPLAELQQHPAVEVLAASDIAGAYLLLSKDKRNLFVIGHPEYQKFTLRDEYQRDRLAGLQPAVPVNYFPDDDPDREPVVCWQGHGSLLVSNWLNYYVYQQTPYDLADVSSVTSWTSGV